MSVTAGDGKVWVAANSSISVRNLAAGTTTTLDVPGETKDAHLVNGGVFPRGIADRLHYVRDRDREGDAAGLLDALVTAVRSGTEPTRARSCSTW